MIESLVDSFMINRNRNHLEPERALKLVFVNCIKSQFANQAIDYESEPFKWDDDKGSERLRR